MRFDVIIAGGGLAGGLIAYRLAHLRPDLRLALVDAAPTYGGDHTWSFFGGDVSAEQLRWLDPFIVHRWPGYEVRFPRHRTRLTTPYHSVTSERFNEVVTRALPAAAVVRGTGIVAIEADHVVLADQRVLHASAVIDARGAGPDLGPRLAYQKFVGLEVETHGPHGLAQPIVMDATVPQHDGYRFVYSLPFSPTRLLIEDTYYADGAALEAPAIEARIMEYAAAQGWKVARVVRREAGVLPIALGGDMTRAGRTPGVARAGMRGGLFHPLTGYSLPDAAKAADLVAALPRVDAATVEAALDGLAGRLWSERSFHRLLARLLFEAGRPERRYKVLERFYTLPQQLVERLHAGTTTMGDRARILCGKPPVPFFAALGVVMKGDR